MVGAGRRVCEGIIRAVKLRLCHNTDPYWRPHPLCSGAFRSWLIDEGSLTRRLQSCCANFAVRKVRQTWARPLPDEALLLGLRHGTAAWIREVWLCDGDVPLVFARSVLPRNSLRDGWRGLGQLGSRPLGAALFADVRVVRRPLAFRKLARKPSALNKDSKTSWARRSVFVRDGRKILVTEAFLPAVLEIKP